MLLKRKGYFLLLSFLYIIFPSVYSQDQKVADSLAIIYTKGMLNDTARLELLSKLSFNEVKDLNLSLQYAEELINLSKELENNTFLHTGYFQKGNKKRLFGNLEEAMDAYIKSAEVAHLEKNARAEGNAYGAIADIYSISNNHPNARLYYNKAIAILRGSKDSISLASFILNAGEDFMNNQIYDTAYSYFEESRIIFENLSYLIGVAYSIGNIGMVYANAGESELAEKNIKEAIEILEELGDYYPVCVYLVSMAEIYIEKGDERAALNYALRSLELSLQYELKEQIRDANLKLSELYEQVGNMEESYRYYKDYITFRDSINNVRTVQSMANLRTDFEVSQKQIEVDLLSHQKQNQRWWLITIAGMLFTAFVLLYMFYRNNKNKQKANILLQKQKQKVEITLTKLKSTQSQLIQAEKMASLGELTAGIAHEIQNPLNFVNNFSEISIELVDEMEEELENGDLVESKEIVSDIKQNLEKINNHGQRASSIIKGMLQHSRTSTGQKELTDINALADEYLRLAYHGMQAKDKSFNVDFVLEVDKTLPNINAVQQDIGRVLLNLINNAFYTVYEKAKQNDSNYKPLVKVTTKKLKNNIEITIHDNGNGIPNKIKDKIFQPFFTTKPAGQGTGLGLSMSYDIITKGHNGRLEVKTQENIETEFIITLPTN